MTEKIEITRVCDHCGADLTTTDAAYDWHYVLSGEYMPRTSRVGYDPHPRPPRTSHFCDKECLARWLGNSFGNDLSYEMVDAGGNAICATGKFGSAGNYAEQRRTAKDIFLAMWRARTSSVGKQAAAVEVEEQGSRNREEH